VSVDQNRGEGHYDHVDQLVRSGGSMPRNIAERAGEWKPKEKAKFFRYAKRSADECAATLDTMVDYDMLREEDIKHAKELLARIIPMLIRLIKLFEEGRSAVEVRTGTGTGTGTRPVARARARGT
jgi:four helix bundle protein